MVKLNPDQRKLILQLPLHQPGPKN